LAELYANPQVSDSVKGCDLVVTAHFTVKSQSIHALLVPYIDTRNGTKMIALSRERSPQSALAYTQKASSLLEGELSLYG